MPVKDATSGITFAVHDVEPSSEKLAKQRTDYMVTRLLNAVESKPGGKIEACSGYNEKIVGCDCNALIYATYTAFAQHYGLVLSPDMLWITILQGFAQHVELNSNAMRKFFVKHLGQKTLTVEAPYLEGSPENDWGSVIHAFAELVHENVGGAYRELVSDFTTTGDLERLVCELSLMDVFKPYFKYEMMCVCGIPEITLEGTPADWRNLQAKIELLAKYDLEWWLKDLRMIAEQFCRAAEGDVDTEFWQDILKLREAYGATDINGWVARIIPYVKDHHTGVYNRRNPILSGMGSITTECVPSGLSQVPFVMKWQNGKQQDMQFLGGFVGMSQDEENGALRPKLGWAIRQPRRMFGG